METDNVSFGAKYIGKAKIQKFDKGTKKFVTTKANFVKLTPCDYYDIHAVDTCTILWNNAGYIKKIATASHWMKAASIDIYALTEQKENFERLQPEKILGFADLRQDWNRSKYQYLSHLQIKPWAQNINNMNDKAYKHVGSALLNSLKKVYNNISLSSVKNSHIEEFYKKNGFIEEAFGSGQFLWSSNIIRRMKIKLNQFRYSLGV